MVDPKYYNYAVEQMDRAIREKRKYNGYKDKADRRCFYTGISCADRHEVYGGPANRKISMRHGFQVDLLSEKHAALHSNKSVWAREENRKWRETYQRAYMDRLMTEGKINEDDALELWMNLIGRNYLEECDPL